MTPEFAKALVEAAESDGIEMTARDDYSGRGMYGKVTSAVVCDSWRDFAAAVALVVADHRGEIAPFEEGDTIPNQVRKLSSDSMGRDQIVIY